MAMGVAFVGLDSPAVPVPAKGVERGPVALRKRLPATGETCAGDHTATGQGEGKQPNKSQPDGLAR